jgi:hypothetical protein
MGLLSYVRSQLFWAVGESGATPVDPVDLEGYDQNHLMNNNTRIVLTWNGTTYVLPKYTPSGAYAVNHLADTSRLREFVGPMDPSTMSGVVMGNYDSWVPTA